MILHGRYKRIIVDWIAFRIAFRVAHRIAHRKFDATEFETTGKLP